MTDETLPTRLDPFADGGGYAPPPPSASPVLNVLRALRGRYAWAIGIGAVLALSGTLAGALLPRPLYRSVGMIEIAPTVPRILFHTEEKGVPPMFEAYVAAQATLMTSRRVVDLAMSTPEWRRFGRGLSDPAVAEFQSSLSCDNPRRSHFLSVAFTDEDPDAATVAVNQVIKSYMKLVEERERDGGASRNHILLGQQTMLTNRLQSLRADVLAATDNLGTAAIQTRYTHLLGQINRDDALIHEADLDISAARDAGMVGPADPAREPTAEELSVVDDVLDSLLVQQADKRQDLEYLTRVEGRGQNHPAVLRVLRDLDQIELRIRERVERVKQMRAADGAPLLTVQAIADREKRRDRIKLLRQSAHDEAKSMSLKLAEVANLEAEQGAALTELEQIRQRLSQIDLESEPGTDQRHEPGQPSREAGHRPPAGPRRPRRRGRARPRLRRGRAVGAPEREGPPHRGRGRRRGARAVPRDPARPGAGRRGDGPSRRRRRLGGDGGLLRPPRPDDAPARALVAEPRGGVHEPVARRREDDLALAVGCSYGASGARTLVVDCDLIGHGLSSSLADVACGIARDVLLGAGGARASDGVRGQEGFVRRILAGRRSGVAPEDLEELRAACRNRTANLDPDVDRVVRSVEAATRYRGAGGAQRRRGLLDALTGTPLDDCMVETCFPNVWVLPVGEATERDAERLSPAGLDRLLGACRSRFDVILVDTGPILGSLEAAFVTVKADDVVLVVPRGELQSVVDGAMRRLESAGARVAGVVFNRARPEDAARSSFASRPSDDDAEAE